MLEWIYRGLSKGRITTRYPKPGAAAPAGLSDAIAVADGSSALALQARSLRHSVHVRHIDCGSDGSEEWEIQALWNPYYDIQRLGFFLTNSPRHADVLLVTGAVTAPMRVPLQRTWEIMPSPKALIAIGDDACGKGICASDAARADGAALTAGGVDRVLPVDVYVPGSPPAPVAIMQGLLLATGVSAGTFQQQQNDNDSHSHFGGNRNTAAGDDHRATGDDARAAGDDHRAAGDDHRAAGEGNGAA